MTDVTPPLTVIVRSVEGTIDWYCIDYWSRELELDIGALKRELEHMIQVHPHVAEFLQALRTTGKRVAIVGAGPAGLSAAYHLLQAGHGCMVFDEHELPGGALRYAVPEEKLPRKVLDDEISVIERLGVTFRMGARFGDDFSLGDLQRDYDAVLLATGVALVVVGVWLGRSWINAAIDGPTELSAWNRGIRGSTQTEPEGVRWGRGSSPSAPASATARRP